MQQSTEMIFILLICLQFFNAVFPMDYCTMNKNHVLCDYKGKVKFSCPPKFKFYKLDEKQQEEILSSLNSHRREIAKNGASYKLQKDRSSPVANMMKMVWDEELAKTAEAIARNCKGSEPCPGCIDLVRFQSSFVKLVIEFSGKVREPAPMRNYIKHLMTSRKSNSLDNFKTNYEVEHTRKEETESYNYLTLAEAYLIGCGLTIYSRKNEISLHTFVCTLGPVVPSEDQHMYLSGKPCSVCPKGSRCINPNDSLCDCEGLCYPFEYNFERHKRDAEATTAADAGDTDEGSAATVASGGTPTNSSGANEGSAAAVAGGGAPTNASDTAAGSAAVAGGGAPTNDSDTAGGSAAVAGGGTPTDASGTNVTSSGSGVTGGDSKNASAIVEGTTDSQNKTDDASTVEDSTESGDAAEKEATKEGEGESQESEITTPSQEEEAEESTEPMPDIEPKAVGEESGAFIVGAKPHLLILVFILSFTKLFHCFQPV